MMIGILPWKSAILFLRVYPLIGLLIGYLHDMADFCPGGIKRRGLITMINITLG